MKDNTVFDFANIDGSNKIKGTPVSFGNVKARACVAMNLDEAQNIQVFLSLNLVLRSNHLMFSPILIEWRYFDNL